MVQASERSHRICPNGNTLIPGSSFGLFGTTTRRGQNLIRHRRWRRKKPPLINKAIGLVFSFDPRRSKMAKVKHLSENENADKIVAAWWTPSSETGHFRKVKPSVGLLKPGVVQVEVDVTDPETATDFFFVLFGALGHGIYL